MITLREYSPIVTATMLLAFANPASASTANGQQAKAPVASKTLTITGWPVNWQQPVWQLAENDPIFGTLVCPALTQLDLASKKSEPQLAKAIKADDKTWQISLSSKAAYWDGQQVTSKSVAALLKTELAPHIERMFAGRLAIPKASYATPSATSLKITWQSKPKFGPYVLNNLPVRKKTDAGWQCAGAFEPMAKGDAKTLALASPKSKAKRGKKPKFSYIQFVDAAPLAKGKKAKKASHSMHFQFAESFAGNPWRRLSDQKISCKRTMPTSVITAIMWNPKGRFTSDRTFRGAMTHLTPRGALLRSGGGNLGKLVSAPIPRHHPGYNRRVFVRSFSYPKAIKILEQLGYKRPVHDKPRNLPDGKTPLVLNIGTMSPEGPLHKVLSDSYMSVGITLKYVPIKDAGAIPANVQKTLDGVLMGLKLPYPSGNILPLLTTASPFGDGYASLGRHFIPYLRSLSTGKPDFGKLRSAHVALYQYEPMSVLMQYSQCLSVSSPKIAVRKTPNVKNPEWLKNIIF